MEVPPPTDAVLGASRNPRKFGHLSVQAHLRHGYKVFPINPHAETIAGVPAYASLGQLPVEAVDRITVYLPPEAGITHLDQMVALHPKEVWFNPGSESDELLTRAEQLGLPVIAACSLIDLESRAVQRNN